MTETNKEGMGLLDIAALNNHGQLIEVLLGAGCDPEVRNSKEMTPLMYSAKDGRVDALEVLLKNGARYGIGLVWYSAVRDGHGAVVCLLLRHGMNPNGMVTVGESGSESVLSIAVRNGHKAVADILIKAGAKA